MEIGLKYFGMIVEKTSIDQEVLNVVEEISLQELSKVLLEKHPDLSQVHFSFSVNMTIISDGTHCLTSGDEIALLPAFAGG